MSDTLKILQAWESNASDEHMMLGDNAIEHRKEANRRIIVLTRALQLGLDRLNFLEQQLGFRLEWISTELSDIANNSVKEVDSIIARVEK